METVNIYLKSGQTVTVKMDREGFDFMVRNLMDMDHFHSIDKTFAVKATEIAMIKILEPTKKERDHGC